MLRVDNIYTVKSGLLHNTKGFHQAPDTDFLETFSPIIKPATI